MKKRIAAFILAVLTIVSTFALFTFGVSADAAQVSDSAGLLNALNSTSVNIVLTNDIDLNPGFIFGYNKEYKAATIYEKSTEKTYYLGTGIGGTAAGTFYELSGGALTASSKPAGLNSISCYNHTNGVNIDGGNHRISGVFLMEDGGNTVNDRYVGFIGIVSGGGAVIKNLTVDGTICYTNTAANEPISIGGIVGRVQGCDMTLENITSEVTVISSRTLSNDTSSVGGVIGCFNGVATTTYKASLKKVTNKGAVIAKKGTGGVLGATIAGTTVTFENVKNEGDVYGAGKTGGVLGFSQKAAGNGTLQNIFSGNISNVGNITSTGDYNGGIAGHVTGAVVSFSGNIVNEGDVSASGMRTGGIIGNADAAAHSFNGAKLANYGAISGTVATGGIGGRFIGSSAQTLTSAENYGNVTATDQYTGGMFGILSSVRIELAYNNGDIVSTNDRVGGIVGYYAGNQSKDGIICSKCINDGTISGKTYVGGVVGYAVDALTVERSVNRGTVGGISMVGGIAGFAENSKIRYCEQLVKMTVGSTTNMGGIAGGTSKYNFNDEKAVSGCINSAGITNTSSAVGGSENIKSAADAATGAELNESAQSKIFYMNIGTDEYVVPFEVDALGNTHKEIFHASASANIPAALANGADGVFVGYIDKDRNIYEAGQTVSSDKYLNAFFIDFYMSYGASVRTKNPTGLRWVLHVSEDGLAVLGDNADTMFGTMIVPTSYAESFNAKFGSFSAQLLAEHSNVTRVDVPNTGWYESDEQVKGYKTYCSSIINILEDNYNLAFSSVGYLKITYQNGNTAYISAKYETDSDTFSDSYDSSAIAANSRSIRYVAARALEDKDKYSDAVVKQLKVYAGQ